MLDTISPDTVRDLPKFTMPSNNHEMSAVGSSTQTAEENASVSSAGVWALVNFVLDVIDSDVAEIALGYRFGGPYI
jgi:hypothetical protein